MIRSKNLQLIIFLLFILFWPFLVMADSYETEYSKDNGYIRDFYYGSIEMKTMRSARYANLNGKGNGIYYDATINNHYSRHVDLNVTLNIYNENGGKLDSITKEFSIDANGSATFETYLYPSDFYDLDDVSYFNYTLDLLTDISVTENNDSYYMSDYNIKINVNSNNVYDVSESFKANFKKYVDEFSLGVPLRLKYVRLDGTSVNKRIVLSDIIVDDYYTLDIEKGVRLLNIGTKDEDNDYKEYNIQYTYNVGKDTLDGNDEVVFYLVSNVNAKLNSLSFEVILPDEVDYEDVTFIDDNGLKLEDVQYQIDDNVITGKINRTIEPNSKYAIYISLPDGYFKDTLSTTSKFAIISIVVPIIFVLFTIFIWFISKKFRSNITFNKMYFNKYINSLELGYLYNGKVKDSDIATLLFCLANKGYLKISLGKKSYTITKLKEYDSNDRVEKAFMKELFYDSDSITKKDLSLSILELRDSIKMKLNDDKRKKKLYIHPIFNYKIIFKLMIMIIFILSTANIILEYQPRVLIVNLLVCGIGYAILLRGVVCKKKIIEKVLYVLISAILILTPIMLSSYEAYIQDKMYLIFYFISIICMIIIYVVMGLMSDRTSYGSLMLKKIRGYKNYLINCSDEDIDKELKSNNNLLSDLLPYTLVLGISDKVVSKFEGKNIVKPSWYECTKFDLDSFYKNVKNIYSDIFILLKNSEIKK